jgi:hypothetical protein
MAASSEATRWRETWHSDQRSSRLRRALRLFIVRRMKLLSLTKICCAAAVFAASVAPLMAETELEKGEAFLKENAKKKA